MVELSIIEFVIINIILLVVFIILSKRISRGFKKDAQRRLDLIPGLLTISRTPIGDKKPLLCRLQLHKLGQYETVREGETYEDTVKIKTCLRCGIKFVQAECFAMCVPLALKDDGTLLSSKTEVVW